MRIALDARTIYTAQRRGIGKSLLELYRHLSIVRPDWEVIAYHRQPGRVEPLLPRPFVSPKRIEMRGDRFHAWDRLRLPLACKRDRVDVLHSPANTCADWMPVPTVVTIHDLIPLDIPEGQDPKFVERFGRSVRTACAKAGAINCPSQYTRQRLIKDMNADPDRVFVTPWSHFGKPGPVDLPERVCLYEKYRVEPPFVLHFGAREPRKNTRRVIEAWAGLRKPIKQHARLLILGLDAEAQAEFATCCARLGAESSIILNGFADEADIPALMRMADVLAYPSLSEGFGLPILEAYAAGTAVITSDRTSLPEVAGDAAMIVDPLDFNTITKAMHKLLTDPVYRRELVRRGLKRLKTCTWEHTAEQFAQAVEYAVKAGQPAGGRIRAA
ncbi:MAG: glycosyltransferase family 1 protein [Phycisphaeraceae bacterium]